MRIANVEGRAVIVLGEHADHRWSGADVTTASGGRFGPTCDALLEDWEAFVAWGRGILRWDDDRARVHFGPAQLQPPSPAPRQVFAIGRNYHEDPAAVGSPPPATMPPTFTKFPSALTGADAVVDLPRNGATDWEVEVVAIIGTAARNVATGDAWAHVAGLTIGQDLSERRSQMAGPVPQFSLGKSYPGFAPVGPWIVTLDELEDPDRIELGCVLDGETVQHGDTGALIFSVPELIARLSAVVTLLPGDLVFTGTPPGVGQSLEPPRFLVPGQELVSWATGLGSIRQRFTGAEGEGSAR